MLFRSSIRPKNCIRSFRIVPLSIRRYQSFAFVHKARTGGPCFRCGTWIFHAQTDIVNERVVVPSLLIATVYVCECVLELLTMAATLPMQVQVQCSVQVIQCHTCESCERFGASSSSPSVHVQSL